MIGSYQKIRTCFTRRIGTIRCNRCLFCEKSCLTKRSVYFISRDMDEFLNFMFTSSFQQDLCAQYIRFHENVRFKDTTVYMRLRGKMDNRIDSLVEQTVY